MKKIAPPKGALWSKNAWCFKITFHGKQKKLWFKCLDKNVKRYIAAPSEIVTEEYENKTFPLAEIVEFEKC